MKALLLALVLLTGCSHTPQRKEPINYEKETYELLKREATRNRMRERWEYWSKRYDQRHNNKRKRQ